MGEDEGNKLGEGDKDEDGGGRKTEEKGKKKLNQLPTSWELATQQLGLLSQSVVA